VDQREHLDGLILVARPLRQIIVHINHPHPIENMTRWFEARWNLGRVPKIKQGWKRQPHLASFVRNQRSTHGTADFARQNSLMLMTLAIVEAEMIDAVRDSHVAFVKDGGPLHGRAVQLLADHAMTYFRVNRICTHFVLNGLTVATGVVFCRKRLIPNRRKFFSQFFLHIGDAFPLGRRQ
jgi:hypothetical protein